MNFDISRQPLVPAFLTLFTLAVATAYSLDAYVPAAEILATGGRAIAGNITVPGVVITPLGELIAEFQNSHPAWANVITGILILFAGMCSGRLTVRYNLYSVSSCLAIPLFAIVLCCIGIGPDYLTDFTAVTLLALTTKNFSRICTNGYSFDGIFRASLYLGLTVLIAPATLPLLFLLPLAVLLSRRTLREVVAALAGLLLLPLAFCYVNWGSGGTFTAPLIGIGKEFLTGMPLEFFTHLAWREALLLGSISLLVLFAIFFFLGNAYAVGNKPRYILTFNIGVFLFAGVLLCGPAATPGTAAFLAVPSAILLPVLFVRIHRSISLSLYLILLVSAVLSIAIQ